MNDIKKSYDELPYFSSAFQECSPTRIEAIAAFLSLTPPSSQSAKILEIGCSQGGNIFPFALANPEAKVVGIDLSDVQIDKAKEIAGKMKLDNIEFIAKDICELKDEELVKYGKFDYIICHGVYSWVPEFVKDAILKTIKRFLSPNGVAYISYNVYPGWKMKDAIRDFLLFGTQNLQREFDKTQKAKELLNVLKDYMQYCKDNGATTEFMNTDLLLRHIEDAFNGGDYYLFHEYLEGFNTPVYFKDFAKSLDDNGLVYLTEVSLDDVFKSNLGIDEFDAYIDANFTNRIDKEQTFDFLTNKVFRKSLIVHKELMGDDFHADIGANELAKLYLAINFTKDSDKNYLANKSIKMNPGFNWLYQVFNDMYPANINFAQVVPLLEGETAIKSAFMGFMEILSADAARLSTFELKKLSYEVGKTRLKDRARGYFEYFASTDNPQISFANRFNQNIIFSQFDAITALKFDGKNSKEDIIRKTVKFAKDNNLNFSRDAKTLDINLDNKKRLEKIVKDYVQDIEIQLIDGYFFENF